VRRLLRVPAAATCDRLAAGDFRPPHRLDLSFYGAPYSLYADDDTVLTYLGRVYRYFGSERQLDAKPERSLLLSSGSPSWEALVGELRPGGSLGITGHLLLTSGFGWALELGTEALLRYYASKLLRLALVERFDDEIVTLHAASLLGPSGAGVLLIGEAAAGKTSTTLRLLDRDWRYGADDTSCVRRRDAVCLPFPMPLILRAELGSDRPDLAELARREPDIAILDEPRWLVERWHAVAPKFPVTHLVFLSQGEGPTGEGADSPPVTPISGAEAALRLLGNVMLPLGADPDGFDADGRNWVLAAELADRAICLAADTRDLDRAFEGLLEHLERPVAVA
jgi:hypothetical protein